MTARRRVALALVLTMLLCGAASGQSRIYAIGFLTVDRVQPSPLSRLLADAMRDGGYVVDRNIRIEDRTVLSGYGGLGEAAAALVDAKVDVIVTYGSTATLAAARATRNVPIVMLAGMDPVAAGLAASLARPGGNVTGVNTFATDLSSKRVELLKEMLPGLKRIGILYAPEAGAGASRLEATSAAARALGMDMSIAEVRKPAELEDAFAALVRSRIDGLVILPSRIFFSDRARVVEQAARHRLPAIYPVEEFIDAGGLMVYTADIRNAFGHAATQIERVLKGARPGDLPIAQPTKFELIINVKAAKQIGISIPSSIQLRADRLVE